MIWVLSMPCARGSLELTGRSSQRRRAGVSDLLFNRDLPGSRVDQWDHRYVHEDQRAAYLCPAAAGAGCSGARRRRSSEQRSAIMIVTAWVLPETIRGCPLASATRKV